MDVSHVGVQTGVGHVAESIHGVGPILLRYGTLHQQRVRSLVLGIDVKDVERIVLTHIGLRTNRPLRQHALYEPSRLVVQTQRLIGSRQRIQMTSHQWKTVMFLKETQC